MEEPHRVAQSGRLLNGQYNIAPPGGVADRVATRARRRMFDLFMAEFRPSESDLILDIGATSDDSYSSSNYFEALYPYKDRVIAAGVDDAAVALETRFPGVRFAHADVCDLPFATGEMDLVHAAAVIEHVGSRIRQARMIAECARVARRGLCITTPNRWYPIEFHTRLPVVHWLPSAGFRRVLRSIGQEELGLEENLNLMSARDLRAASSQVPGWEFRVARIRLVGVTSNLLLLGQRSAAAGQR